MNKKTVAAYLTLYLSYLTFIFVRAVHFHENGNLFATPPTIWGDWAVHFTMATGMAYRSLILTSSPLLIFAPFHYPFLANLISALLIRAGVPFTVCFWGPSLLFTAAGGILLFVFYRRVFQSNSAAVAGHVLFHLNGGFGFVWLLKLIRHSPTPWKVLFNPPPLVPLAEPYPLVWDSVIRGILLPQRSFQLGFVLGMSVLVLLGKAMQSSATERTRLWWGAGICAGLLPMSHLHTFAAIGVVCLIWMIGDLLYRRQVPLGRRVGLWARTGVTAVFLASLQLIFLQVAEFGKGTSRIQWGWYANESVWQWIKFWIINWGFTPFAAIFGFWLFWRNKSTQPMDRQKMSFLFLPFVILFILLNIVIFQPWIWDNTKMLAWVSVGVSGWAGYALVKIWGKRRLAASVLAILLCLSGGIEAARLLHPKAPENELYTKEEFDLTAWTLANTESSGTWLTSYHHNNWVYNLAGRQVIMAYDGWLWSHGYNYGDIKTDVETLLKDPTRKELLDKYDVVFACVGPIERDRLGADPKKFDLTFDRIHSSARFDLFRRKRPTSSATGSKANP